MIDLSSLIHWFREHKRELPWRVDPSPYRVLISEMMLQQTQVKTVLPYFERWMEKFPNLKKLGEASLEEVIKEWEGLGYYSRARYLHEGAKKIGREEITKADLEGFKGIGPYTRGAILSFSFKERAAACDGNVMRVVSRLTGYEEDITKLTSRKEIEKRVLQMLPEEKPWEGMEALIELGALVCQKCPKCKICPLINSCKAFQEGKTGVIPFKKKGPKITKLIRYPIVFEAEGHYLVGKGAKGKLMADLYEFPFLEDAWCENELKKRFQADILEISPLNKQEQGFTRYQVSLFPYHARTLKFSYLHYEWVKKEEAFNLPFSSGHRRVLNSLRIV